MRRRLTVACAVISSAALIGIGVGCGGSSASDSQTPAEATTVANNAPQTDSTGKTVPTSGVEATTPADAVAQAPAADAGGGAEAPAADAAGGAEGTAGGDVAAGKTAFEASCQGCHTAGGTQAGVGPKLQGAGLAPTAIETKIVNGGGAMPPGLVSGTDLTNVVAYVSSLQ